MNLFILYFFSSLRLHLCQLSTIRHLGTPLLRLHLCPPALSGSSFPPAPPWSSVALAPPRPSWSPPHHRSHLLHIGSPSLPWAPPPPTPLLMVSPLELSAFPPPWLLRGSPSWLIPFCHPSAVSWFFLLYGARSRLPGGGRSVTVMDFCVSFLFFPSFSSCLVNYPSHLFMLRFHRRNFPQELGTLGHYSVCFHRKNQDLNKVPGKKVVLVYYCVMKSSFKSISGKNIVVWNSNLQFICKDSTCLKMCFANFGDVRSTWSAGAQCSCIM